MKEVVKFTRELVRIPSQSGIDSEKEITKLIFKKLKSFGFSPKIIGPREHPSVICLLKKPKAKRTVWLESCIDTVPAGDLSKWRYSPFEAKIIRNKMYGRGVADSKIGGAIFSYLAKVIYQDSNFQGNIFLGFDADEQSGNFTGIKSILEYAPRADICILGYQGREEISIGARGWLRFKLTTLGKSAHTGARYSRGINAIHKMQKAIDNLLKSDFLKKKERFFEYGPSLNASLIKGGLAINIVPDKCEAFFDIRFLPSQNQRSILKEIIERLNQIKRDDRDFNFRIKVFQSQNAFLTNPNHPFLKILKRKAQDVLKRKISLATSGAGSVGSLIAKKNIPIVNGLGCQVGNIHALNEWVNLLDISKIFEIYKSSLIEFSNQ